MFNNICILRIDSVCNSSTIHTLSLLSYNSCYTTPLFTPSVQYDVYTCPTRALIQVFLLRLYLVTIDVTFWLCIDKMCTTRSILRVCTPYYVTRMYCMKFHDERLTSRVAFAVAIFWSTSGDSKLSSDAKDKGTLTGATVTASCAIGEKSCHSLCWSTNVTTTTWHNPHLR